MQYEVVSYAITWNKYIGLISGVESARTKQSSTRQFLEGI